MKYGSKGMTCNEFVQLMRERGIAYDEKIGHFIKKNGVRKSRLNSNGYMTISLSRNHVEYTFCEHRCVWVWHNGEIPDGMEINHIDANRSNNKIENLEIVDHSGNMRHAISIGNFAPCKAEKSGKAIYTNEEVLAMRALYRNGWSVEDIQNAFNAKWKISISRLIHGKRYGSVAGEMPLHDALTIIQRRSGIA